MGGGRAAKDSVHARVLTALGELRHKHFIEDLLKGAKGNSDRMCVSAE